MEWEWTGWAKRRHLPRIAGHRAGIRAVRLSPGIVLANSILALGFGISFYYGMTGSRLRGLLPPAVVQEPQDFLFIGLAPLLGGLMLAAMFVISIFYYSNPINSAKSGQAWFKFIQFNVHVLGVHLFVKQGVSPILVIGVGLLVIGFPIMLLWRVGHADFFRRSREAAASLHASAPPLTPGVLPVTD